MVSVAFITLGFGLGGIVSYYGFIKGKYIVSKKEADLLIKQLELIKLEFEDEQESNLISFEKMKKQYEENINEYD